jgi:hypothetical protein
MTLNGQLDLNAGAFTSTSGTLTLGEDFELNVSGSDTATFAHNNGTFTFAMEATSEYLYGNPAFYDMIVNGTSSTRAIRMRGGSAVTVSNSLTLTAGEIDSYTSSDHLELSGTFSKGASFGGGTGTIEFITDVDVVGVNGETYPGFRFTHASSSYAGPGGGTTVTFEGAIDVGAGTFTAGAGTNLITGFTHTSSGTFTHSSGEIVMTGGTWDVDTSETFFDLAVNGSTSTIPSGDTLIVSGDLTLVQGAFNTGTIRATGTVSDVSVSFDGGTGIAEIACACSFSNPSTQMSGLNLNNAGAAYTSTNGTTQRIEGDLTLTAGTFVAGANEIEMQKNLNNIGGTFTHSNGTISFDLGAGSAPVTRTVDGDFAFYTLDFEPDYSLTVEFNAGDTYSANSLTENNISRGGAKIFFISDTPGSDVTFNVATASTVDDMTFTDINNGGAGTVTCRHRCVDGGNNTGFDIGFDGVTVTDVSSLTVSETGTTSTFTVRLDRQPSADVTITPVSSDTTEATVGAALTFTSVNYYTTQTVTITGADDALDDGDLPVTVTMTATSGDSGYSGISIPSRTVTVYDDDTADDSIDFDVAANFTAQDVKDTGSADILYFDYDYVGYGYFEDTVGGAGSAVDLSSSDIKAGCMVDVAGTIYQITTIIDAATGWVSLTDLPVSDALKIHEEAPFDGVVNSIRCTGDSTGFNKGALSSGFITANAIADAGASFDGLTHDSVNDKVMVSTGSDSTLTFTSTTTAATTVLAGVAIAGNGAEWGYAFDPTRGYTWWAEYSSDTITAFDGATNSWAFTTEVASKFSVTDRPSYVVYDSTQDAIWIVGNGSSAALTKLDASDGSLITTTDLSSLSLGNFVTALAYDSNENAIWISINDDDVLNDAVAVLKIDATDGTAYISDFGTSTFDSNQYGEFYNSSIASAYDVSLGELYQLNAQCDSTGSPVDLEVQEYLSIIDDAGATIGHIATGSSCVYGMYHDEASDTVYLADGSGNNIYMIDLASRSYTRLPGPSEAVNGVVLDDEGDIWTSDTYDTLYEMVFDGVPTGSYYAVTTTDSAQLDVSADGGLSGVTVDETLDSGTIYYALSFDDRSSFVTFASPGRVIVSDRDADTGLGDGTYAYRDNANSWTAAPQNTAESALSLAVQQGANNQMSGTTLGGLDSTSLEDTNGFEAGVTTTLDVGIVLYSTDAHNAPTVNDLTFDLSASVVAGGGTTTIVSTTGESISVDNCTGSREISVTLGGNDIADYILTEDAGLVGATWESFVTEVPFILSTGDGEKIIYAKFRSNTGNQSEVIQATITLDEANGCAPDSSPAEGEEGSSEGSDSESSEGSEGTTGSDGGDGSSGGTSGGGFGLYGDLDFMDCLGNQRTILADERNTFMFGVAVPGRSLPQGVLSQISQVDSGDYIRSESFDTVYCINENLDRRPFVGETDYFTHTRSFLQTRWVTDETLGELPLVGPMLPKIGISLLKFESAHNVYLHEENPDDSTKGLLYWITTEELAAAMVGSSWAAFVIDVSTTLFPRFDFGEALLHPREVDTSTLRERELLNEGESATDSTEEVIVESDVSIASFMERFKSILPGK